MEVEAAAPARNAVIIEVGGGGVSLVDDLLARGYRDLTVPNLFPAALEVTRRRLVAPDNLT
ncbi:hypothetical protein [Halomonas nitroreducens]|uniref:Uncharacterized protein n=1 Tax=Halomonas nitroreducens TaxID=447425 RepID=A0A3S0HSE2_9GAMM|nr:hypothetical protein [Halomonas nitroreducens]RTR06542.1 hypothetical protein EKG36_03465 [Halomonas nitroreducens]